MRGGEALERISSWGEEGRNREVNKGAKKADASLTRKFGLKGKIDPCRTSTRLNLACQTRVLQEIEVGDEGRRKQQDKRVNTLKRKGKKWKGNATSGRARHLSEFVRVCPLDLGSPGETGEKRKREPTPR